MADLNDIFQKSLREARKGNTFAPAEALQKLQDSGVKVYSGYDASTCNKIHIDETNEEALLNAEYGPQQVESLLALVVDFPLHHRMEGALDDEDAVRHLNRLKNRDD
jgi:hypothetical protein